MNDLLGRSPSTKQLGHRAKRLLTEDEDTRSLIAGLILTLIFWPAMFWLFGKGMGHMNGQDHPKHLAPPKKAFSIDFVPKDFQLPKKPVPPPDRFVETNPNAPENIPDKTRNFAAQNQQVAQEKPTPDGKNDMPALEGKKDIASTQIVSGDLNPPEKSEPIPPPPSPEVAPVETQAEARKEQAPLPGFEKREGESKTGFGSTVAAAAERATSVPERIQGAKDAPVVEGPVHPTVAQVVPQKPLPRPHLQQVHARPAIFTENKLGTQNIGPIAVDARWSNYGQYLQKLLETVQVQWERIIIQSSVYPPPGSTVTVKFRIEASEGNISEIIDTASTGGKQAAEACKSAITARAPYGKWTDDMVAVLGQSQEMTFTFYYNP